MGSIPITNYLPHNADNVPDLINQTTEIVTDMLDLAVDRSGEALTEALEAIEALKEAQLPSKLPDPPTAPNLSAAYNASVNFSLGANPDLGTITPQSEPQYVPEEIVIPDFAETIRDYVPLISGLTIPEPPVFALPAEPSEPAINTDIAIPDAPTPDYGSVPTLIDPELPTFVLPVLPVYGLTAPEFTDAAPDPFIQWQEPVYTSDIRDAVRAVLEVMLEGGTGLTPEVERAIWERARGREDAAALKLTQEARDLWGTRGHEHPTGQLNSQILVILDDAQRKANEHSREVMIEQAKLEQGNRQFAVQQAINYEQVFVNLFLQIVDRNFQIAKFGVEMQVTIFNARVTAFNARVAAFGAGVEAYKAQLEGAFAQIRAYEAQVNAERVKGEINKIRLEAFTAKVQAFTAQVAAFKALVEAAATQAQMEKNKVDIYRGEVDAYVGKINGQRAAFEAYQSRVQGEQAKAQLEEANAKAYSAYVQGVATRAELTFKDAEVRVQKNKLLLEYAVANMQRLTQFTTQELNVIQAVAASYDVKTRRDMAAFEAQRALRDSERTTVIELSRNMIARYSAMLEAWRTDAAHILAIANLNSDSMKAAGQIAATLAAGAMAGTHVSAGVSGSAGATQSKGLSTSFTQSEGHDFRESNNVNHNYDHAV